MTAIIMRMYNAIFTSPDKKMTIVHIGGLRVARLHGQSVGITIP